MATGVDYSSARYTAAELKARGIAAVGRYLTGQFAISPVELAELVMGGILVWFIFEDGTSDYAGGVPQGRGDATLANMALANLGIPSSQPVYFTVDTDVANPEAAVPYFQGIAALRPPATNGDYGEGALAALLAQLGLTAYHWQSESTSFPGNASTLEIADLQQELNGAPLANTDLDDILKTDFGQYPRPTAGPLPGGASMADFPGAVAVAQTADGKGAWVVSNTGAIYTAGDAPYLKGLSDVGVHNVTNIVGIFRSFDGGGYYLLGADGGVFAFGDAQSFGAYPGLPAADRQGSRSFGAGSLAVHWGGTGYTLTALDGSSYGFGT